MSSGNDKVKVNYVNDDLLKLKNSYQSYCLTKEVDHFHQ